MPTRRSPSRSSARKHPRPSVPQPNAHHTVAGDPIFAQPAPSPDPTTFRDPVTDQSYQGIKNVERVPQPRSNTPEPLLTLEQVYGSAGAVKVQAITKAGQIVFHAVGDTGSVKSPTTQNLVSDKMVADFHEANPADVPSFFYHLGDVVYYFGEAAYYYDQFYAPFREYPAPIVGIPGNHDGVLWSGDPHRHWLPICGTSAALRRSSRRIPGDCCAPR
jgi:hypothetical protein